MPVSLDFEFTHFMGRFHPVLVHLPIGFLLLAMVMEGYQRSIKGHPLTPFVGHAWLLSAGVGALAAFCGWWLGETGRYLENDLFLHRWGGILVVVLSLVGWGMKKRHIRYSPLQHRVANGLMCCLLLFVGHLGGKLTHGPSYLFAYAPEAVRQMMLGPTTVGIDLSQSDSVLLYEDLIRPIFEQKCVACHNNEVQRGGLNMAILDSLRAGGDAGPAIVPGQALESRLFQRVTLPQGNIKFMPPVGDALTYDEIKVLEWWLAQGAGAQQKITEANTPESLRPTLLRRYGLDIRPKPHYETVRIEPLDSLALHQLREQGFKVNTLGGNNPLLEVSHTGGQLTMEQLKSLAPAAKHITWLSLARTDLTDEGMEHLAKLGNLTRLRLEKTQITDVGVAHLRTLEHLETLNLYGTQVTKACLTELKLLKNLKRVYLWQTQITSGEAAVLQEGNETLDVVLGGG